jgi:hypothetical protein
VVALLVLLVAVVIITVAPVTIFLLSQVMSLLLVIAVEDENEEEAFNDVRVRAINKARTTLCIIVEISFFWLVVCHLTSHSTCYHTTARRDSRYRSRTEGRKKQSSSISFVFCVVIGIRLLPSFANVLAVK